MLIRNTVSIDIDVSIDHLPSGKVGERKSCICRTSYAKARFMLLLMREKAYMSNTQKHALYVCETSQTPA